MEIFIQMEIHTKAMWEYIGKVVKPTRETSREINPANTLPIELRENKFLLVKPYPIVFIVAALEDYCTQINH